MSESWVLPRAITRRRVRVKRKPNGRPPMAPAWYLAFNALVDFVVAHDAIVREHDVFYAGFMGFLGLVTVQQAWHAWPFSRDGLPDDALRLLLRRQGCALVGLAFVATTVVTLVRGNIASVGDAAWTIWGIVTAAGLLNWARKSTW